MSTDVASARLVAQLAALLDHDTPPWRSGELPPLAHWLMFPPEARQSALGVDGHPARTDDGLPRRMWAGSRVRFLAPVAIGATLTQDITQLSATDKTGRSGRMQFVTLLKRISVDDAVVIEDEHDIVYREAPQPGVSARPPAPAEPVSQHAVTRTMVGEPTALFRFSAITYNAHRIHYDRDYTTQVEGYPGLVVHGPYLATLLMDHWLRENPGVSVRGFEFRALRPVFDGEPFTLGLTGDALSVIDAAGGEAMRARVTR